jgi:osmoprotectant transport system ATP-binding protein
VIRLQQVSKSYDGGATRAVRDVDLEVPAQTTLVLLGESGCGKTTTLKMINRLVDASAGSIAVAGENIASLDPVQLRRKIGYVFQEVGLFPHLSVAENIATVPSLLGWPPGDIAARVRELLELVSLPPSEFAHRYPRELSGGQQQRIGVARALAARPGILLMDEPFGALDPLTRAELQQELQRLRERLGLTIVLVTHDVTEALLLGDRIAVMQGGRIVGQGTPSELLSAPPHPYVASLMEMPRRQAALVKRLTGGRA